MRYLFDLTEKQIALVNKLINEGKYNSVAHFVSTAVENQIYLESIKEPFERVNQERGASHIQDLDGTVLKNEDRRIELIKMNNHTQTVPMPHFPDLSSSLHNVGEEKAWLWGQTNKILPIKIGLRILYSIIESGQWTDLEEYGNEAADIAARYGTMIRKYENKKNKLRDERISAGLPQENKFKSKMRYKGHFLAYMRKDEKLEGAMPFLRFVNLKKNERDKVVIGLTDAGLQFAKLTNPVVDQRDFDKSFTEEEIDFYLDHISNCVKGEVTAIKWLIHKVKSGTTKRESINNELKKEFEKIWRASDAVINTQRAGLMARMYELGLIYKEKNGVNVVYKVTRRGVNFLDRIG